MINVIEIDPNKLHPSPAQKRRFTVADDKNPKILELAQNIRHDGQIEPIIVRRLPDGVREIVCGERRTRACRLLGIDVMAIERDLDDKRAGMMTAAENAQRENLNPIEEAETLEGLHALGWTHAEIADHLKVPLSHVVRRAQLTKLTPKWREVSTQPDSVVHAWRGPHYEKIARFPADVQDSILVDIGDYEGAAGFTVKELSHYLARFLHSIEHAPWKKDDEALVPGVSSCVACNERSDIQPDLFDADDFVETDGYGNPKKDKKKPGARCLNHACWDRKMLAHTQNVEAQLRTEYKDVVVIAEYPYGLPDNSPFKKKAERHYDYREAKQGDKGAKPVVYVDGARVGQTGWVVPNSGGHNAYNTKPKTTGKAKPLKERRAQLDILRSRLVCGYIIDEYEKVVKIGRMPHDYITTRAVAAVCVFGTHGAPKSTDRRKQWDEVSKLHVAGHTVDMLAMIFLSALEQVVSILRTMGNESTWQKKPIDADYLTGACDLLNFDYAALVERARVEKPEPKTWAKLEAEEKAVKKPSKPKAAAKSKAKAKAKAAKKGRAA